MTKTYKGTRQPDGSCFVSVDGKPLPLRLDLANRSPTGFEWGYHGSGPAQLALALLADALGHDQFALRHHQDFKRGYVANLPRDDEWQITDKEILDGFSIEMVAGANPVKAMQAFLDVISRIPSTWTCIRCSRTFKNSPGDGQEVPEGVQYKEGPDGRRVVVGEICRECMRK